MRLLLDTHVFLWAVAGSPLLKAATRQMLQAADEVHVSAASIWEVAIKARLGSAIRSHDLTQMRRPPRSPYSSLLAEPHSANNTATSIGKSS